MKSIKYYIYDILNVSEKNNIDILEFKYDSNTLVIDFYNTLYKQYVIENEKRLGNYQELVKNISFKIPDIFNNIEIDDRYFDLYFWEILENHNTEKILCVEPFFSVGGTVAIYHNYKIVIHSNEKNHMRFPHVHIYDQIGENTYISLLDFSIGDGLILKGKDKKTIIKYIQDNKNMLIDYYNQIIEGKNVGKIVIDIIT